MEIRLVFSEATQGGGFASLQRKSESEKGKVIDDEFEECEFVYGWFLCEWGSLNFACW